MSERGKKYVDPEKKFVVHPDMLDFYRNYRPGQNFQQQVGEGRDKLLADGEIFWNDDHDAEMKQTAKDNTDNAIVRGWKFPKRGRRRK